MYPLTTHRPLRESSPVDLASLDRLLRFEPSQLPQDTSREPRTTTAFDDEQQPPGSILKRKSTNQSICEPDDHPDQENSRPAKRRVIKWGLPETFTYEKPDSVSSISSFESDSSLFGEAQHNDESDITIQGDKSLATLALPIGSPIMVDTSRNVPHLHEALQQSVTTDTAGVVVDSEGYNPDIDVDPPSPKQIQQTSTTSTTSTNPEQNADAYDGRALGLDDIDTTMDLDLDAALLPNANVDPAPIPQYDAADTVELPLPVQQPLHATAIDREISDMHQRGSSWSEIAESINKSHITTSRSGQRSWSANMVYSRFVILGAQRQAAQGQDGAVRNVNENDMGIATVMSIDEDVFREVVREAASSFWINVANELTRRIGRDISADDCRARYTYLH